jgi:transposase
MFAYPKELRLRVVNAIENGAGTIAEISALFGVGPTFIKKMMRWHRAGEDLAPRHGGGPVARLQEPERALLRHEVDKQPDVTLEELQHTLAAQRQVTVSRATICRALQQLGLPRKKKASWPVSGTTRRASSSGNSLGLSRVATTSSSTKWAVTWG